MPKCPYCEYEVDNIAEEFQHMELMHPDVIAQRLKDAGIEPPTDYRQGPDLPSYLTLRELSFTAMIATRLAYEANLYDDEVMIGIHVRDRGMASKAPASWIEFSIGQHNYAIWRNTLDVYRVRPDGAVEDEPIHRNERSLYDELSEPGDEPA